MIPDCGQSLGDLAAQVWLRIVSRSLLRGTNQPDGDRGEDKRDRVDQDCDRGREELHEPAGQAERANLGYRGACRELAVAVDQFSPAYQRWQIGLVSDVEKDRQDADQ